MFNFLNNYFDIKGRNSTAGTEVVAGITTFMTMAYIIFLQPVILAGILSNQPTGMDQVALMAGVCLASAFGSILMGILANYPIALAPGMGENFFFVSVVAACVALGIAGKEDAWQTALGVVFVSGLIFVLVSLFNVRKLIMNSISPSLQYGIAGGIGLFITLLGFQHGGIIFMAKSGHYELAAGNFKSITTVIFIIGLTSTAALHVLRVRGSILWGILIGTITALAFHKIAPQFPISAPPDITPVFAKINLPNVWKHIVQLLPFIIIFAFMDIFDTLGTLIGVGTQAGLMKNNELPESQRAFMADACATLFGAFCGHSTVTSYIESATGVEHGGRTGFTAVITGICFLLAVFFSPFIEMVAKYPVPGINPITAPALIIVGAMMMKSISKINWDDYSEAIPAFLIFAGIPFTFSIADGLTMGFIAYPLIKLLGGKSREAGWLTYLIGIMLVLYLVFIKTAI